MWQYDPKFDPDEKDVSKIPEEVKAWFRGEDMVWDGTAHIPDFQRDTIVYWQSCLKLARTLSKVFAVCLDLPEDYFDPLTTYPGADGVYNYYPALTPEEMEKAGPNDVGIGSHTDLQCFTLLWQDDVGGLQVLSDTQWIKAAPIPGTFVVNIGDFLMRMSNDRFKSTVHRVYNRTTVDRLSMPFFFGFNFNEKCSVLPTCTDENNPPKYEPISCGEVCCFENVLPWTRWDCANVVNTVVSTSLPESHVAEAIWANRQRHRPNYIESMKYSLPRCNIYPAGLTVIEEHPNPNQCIQYLRNLLSRN